MTDEADRSVVWYYRRLPFLGSVMTKDWVHRVGRSPDYQILMQIVVKAVITSCPTAWTSSDGIMSAPADFPFFSGCTAVSTSLRRMGSSFLCLSGDSSVLMDFNWLCTAQSSIRSIGSVSLALL